MSLHLENYNALQNPFVQAIHVQQKALLSIRIYQFCTAKTWEVQFNQMQPGSSQSFGFLEDKCFLSIHQIIKTPQEFVHYSSWLERAFWWGKHTAIFQETFSSIKLPSPITQKSPWFQENVMMRPFPLTFAADPSVATGSTSSKVKCCDQSFVVKCVATLLFYCLSL